LLSKQEFIKASRKFVCIRLETYESKETQDRIRDLLRGTMQNTAFVIYAPDGKTKLTRSSRSPLQIFGERGSKNIVPVMDGMEKIASNYKLKAPLDQAELQDFDSFKQSLNVASADQRLLIFGVSPKSKLSKVKATMRAAFNDEDISGKFHFDVAGNADVKWAESLEGATQKTGIFVVKSGEFGQNGKVLRELPLAVSSRELKSVLFAVNQAFSEDEKRKHYGQHVNKGRRTGVEFENTIAHGEDRDGDGEIDPKGRGERASRRLRR